MELPNDIKNFNKDIDYIFQLTRWALKFLGLWWKIAENSKLFHKFISSFLIFLNSSVLFFSILPRIYNVYINGKTLTNRIILFGPSSFILSNFIKYYLIIYRAQTIMSCLHQIKDDWKIIKTEQDRQIMLKNSQFGRKLTKLCAFFMFSGGYAFNAIMPLWNRHLSKKNPVIKLPPPSLYDILFNTQATPAREIIFSIRMLGSTICYIITTAACGLAAISSSHISGHVDIIKLRLQQLVSNKRETSDDKINDQIAIIIQCHVKILSFSGHVDKMLREICLVEVLSSTFIICWLGYHVMMKWNDSEPISILTYSILLTSLTLNIFIFCYIGEILQEQCALIGNFTYMIDWYKISGKTLLSLLLIIAMANFPRKITACGFMDLTIQSFGSIMRTSVAFLNMLRAVSE